MVTSLFRISSKKLKRPFIKIANYLPYESRCGSQYWNTYKFLNMSQWWAKKELESYQFDELKKILLYSSKYVPYYKDLFNEINFNPLNMSRLSDINHIPFLTKNILRDNLDKLISTNVNYKNIKMVNTYDNNKNPISFYESKKSNHIEWAFITNILQPINYMVGKRNKFVIIQNFNTDDFYEYKGLNLYLSPFKLNNVNIIDYINKINNFKPDYIQAYPSALFLISDFIIRNNLSIDTSSLKGIVCTLENLYSFQRNTIQRAFNNINVHSYYSHNEKSCLATQCEFSDYYHFKSEYGYTELIDKDDNKVNYENSVGEIVCTGFSNYITPFIRYKTEDLAVNTNSNCKCKRNYKLVKRIEGKKNDFLIDRTGNLVSFILHDKPLWNIQNKIFTYQYVQNNMGIIELKITRKNIITQDDLIRLRSDFTRIYKNFSLKISIVNKIKREQNGKFKYLLQNLNIDNYKFL